MKKLYIFALSALSLLAAGCSKENPFDGSSSDGEGQVLKSALSMDVMVDETIRQQMHTRADVSADDFTVVFTRKDSAAPTAKYRYGDMPEVVTLPAGTYTCTATYGENRDAEWESPYYLGSSEEFDVVPYEITSYISPIECRLENIKVTIEFDPTLTAKMSADSYVEVKIGDNNGLKFTTTEATSGKAGYFRHTAETTLVATFIGKVDGVSVVETKSLRGVAKGNHYKIRFKLHDHNGESTGDADANLVVDASVTVTDVERNVQIGDDPLIPEEGDRPNEGGGDTPDPGPGDNQAPTIVGQPPIDLDAVNIGSADLACVLDIKSTAEGGITGFTCDIESPTLTPEELSGVGLDSHLDLVNTPESLKTALEGLGFPVNVGGKKEIQFNLTGFMPMLGALGAGEHHFVLTVTDANGTTTKTLKIKFN